MITLRRVQETDKESLWQWRNDPLTREMSIDRQEVPWADHCAWFERVQSDPNRHLLIGEFERNPIGTVRLDRAAQTAEINITIAPTARGKGFGLALLDAATQYAKTQELVSLTAVIRPANKASQIIFERAGYQPYKRDQDLGYYRLELS